MAVPQRPFYALGLRLASAGALATLSMFVKLSSEMGMALPEIMFWRQALPAVALLLYVAMRGELARLATRRLRTHGVRAITGMVGMVFTLGAVVLLPLPVATILGFTSPLFAVALGAILLREKVGPYRWLAVALGFAGVIVIARPGSMTIEPFGAFVGLGAAFMIALVSIQLRNLGQTEAPIATVFYFAFVGALLMLPLLPFVAVHKTAVQWLVLGGVGLSGLVGQLLLTASLRYGSVASVIVMDYSALAWSTVYGWAVFGELPPATIWFGAP